MAWNQGRTVRYSLQVFVGYDRQLTRTELQQVQARINAVMRESLSTTSIIPDPGSKKLKFQGLRSKPGRLEVRQVSLVDKGTGKRK